MTIPNDLRHVLSIDPEVMHGVVCFTGTRVPLGVLLDNLEEGTPLDQFIREYPSVQRAQVEAVVRWQQSEARRAIGLEKAS